MNMEFNPLRNKRVILDQNAKLEKIHQDPESNRKDAFNVSLEDELKVSDTLGRQNIKAEDLSQIIAAQKQKKQAIEKDIELGEKYNNGQGKLYKDMFNGGDMMGDEKGSQNAVEMMELGASVEKNRKLLKELEDLNSQFGSN